MERLKYVIVIKPGKVFKLYNYTFFNHNIDKGVQGSRLVYNSK